MADESGKYLEEVKKGKPRRFVMICKGVKILSLVVYKKGSIEKYKKQAKEQGKGQIYHGVVDGKGMDIAFNLCAADGFQKPPGKELTLKDHLKTAFGLKFKPSYRIVNELPFVNEDDDDDVVDSAGETENTSTETIDVSNLQTELQTLAPGIKEFVATQPDRRTDILKPTKVVKDCIADPDNNSLEAAEIALTTIKELLNSQSAPTDTTTTEAPDPLAGKWDVAVKKITPLMEEAITNQAGDVQKMRAVIGFAREKADSGDYQGALKSLVMLKKLIDEGAEANTGVDAEFAKIAKDSAFQVRRLQFALRDYEQTLRKDLQSASTTEKKTIEAVIEGASTIAGQLDDVVQKLQVALPPADNPGARAKFASELKSLLESEVVDLAERPNPFRLKVDFSRALMTSLATVTPQTESAN